MGNKGKKIASSTLFRLDTLEQSILYIIKYRVVLNNRQILRLRLELLIRVNTRPKHLRARLGTHGTHLLGHLVRSYSRVS